jgi:REP element-mobilizing transposase RayT
MTLPRSQLVPSDADGVYHCVSRCVRRAWLCGTDSYAGRSFEHRRVWVETRLLTLAEVFAVSVWAYAVMSNHVHVVVEVRAEAARGWSDEEIARRWLTLYPPTDLDLEAAVRSLAVNDERIAVLRARLASLSWLMKSLNEHLARRANAEDGCTGRFWEGRFRCQALLDEAAVLAAMTYVDLNPIRAGMTDRLEQSHHTSIVRRIAAATGSGPRPTTGAEPRPAPTQTDDDRHRELAAVVRDLASSSVPADRLAPIAGLAGRTLSPSTTDYIELVDFTGRHWHAGKPGPISGNAPWLPGAHGRNADGWLDRVRWLGSPGVFTRAMGDLNALADLAMRLGQRWIKGIGAARLLAA